MVKLIVLQDLLLIYVLVVRSPTAGIPENVFPKPPRPLPCTGVSSSLVIKEKSNLLIGSAIAAGVMITVYGG